MTPASGIDVADEQQIRAEERAATLREVATIAKEWRQIERDGKASGRTTLRMLCDEIERLAAAPTHPAPAEHEQTAPDTQLLAWAVSNCHILARRRLKAGSVDAEWWSHVVRICEKAGAESAGVLRAALPRQITDGETVERERGAEGEAVQRVALGPLDYERLDDAGLQKSIRLFAGERLLVLQPFGWHIDGTHIPNAAEHFSREGVCEEHSWEVVCEYGPYVAVVQSRLPALPAPSPGADLTEREERDG